MGRNHDEQVRREIKANRPRKTKPYKIVYGGPGLYISESGRISRPRKTKPQAEGPLPKMAALEVQAFAVQVNARFPANATGPSGDVIAYFHDARHAALIVRAVNAHAEAIRLMTRAYVCLTGAKTTRAEIETARESLNAALRAAGEEV